MTQVMYAYETMIELNVKLASPGGTIQNTGVVQKINGVLIFWVVVDE